MADVPVEIWQLVRDEEGHEVVLLRDEGGRVLPIGIGICEAAAIWVCLEPEQASPFVRRPWSHDLIQRLVERRDARVERVVIDGFTEGIFYATLHVAAPDGEHVVDARPSDALALALRMKAPVLVNHEVMLEAALHPEEPPPDEGRDFWEDLP